MEQMIELAVKTLGGVLVAVLVPLAIRGLKKLGVELDIERQKQVEGFARAAVLRVEEMAAEQAAKRLRTWTGPEKLQAAATEIVDRLPRVDRMEAERIVHAVLPTMGIGAAAAAELGKALQTK